MPHKIQVVVKKRDGSKFKLARVAVLQGPDGGAAPPPAATDFVAADDAGTVTFPLKSEAASRGTVTVTFPDPKKAKRGAWDKDETAYWPAAIDWFYSPEAKSLFVLQAPVELVSHDTISIGDDWLHVLEVRLSRVRLRDELARARSANQYPPEKNAAAPATVPFDYAQSPLIGPGGKLNRRSNVPWPAAPASRNDAHFIEVAEPATASGKPDPKFGPKAVGVYLPSFIVSPKAAIPFLLYFRPLGGQDFPGEAPAPFDRPDYANKFALWGFDFGFQRTFEYFCEPWDATKRFFAHGFIGQVLASHRTLGIIAPVPQPGSIEFGQATNPAFTSELVLEILAYMKLFYRVNDSTLDTAPPAPGRMAVASFSIGVQPLSTFMGALHDAGKGGGLSNPLCENMREVYVFDAPSTARGNVDGILASVNSWPKDSAGIHRRVYSQSHSLFFTDVHNKLKAPAQKTGAIDDTSELLPEADQATVKPAHATSAFLPAACWPITPVLDSPGDLIFFHVHALISQTMLGHALALSEFEPVTGSGQCTITLPIIDKSTGAPVAPSLLDITTDSNDVGFDTSGPSVKLSVAQGEQVTIRIAPKRGIYTSFVHLVVVTATGAAVTAPKVELVRRTKVLYVSVDRGPPNSMPPIVWPDDPKTAQNYSTHPNQEGLAAASSAFGKGLEVEVIHAGELRFMTREQLDRRDLFAIFGGGSYDEWGKLAVDDAWGTVLDHWAGLVRDMDIPMLAVCGSHQFTHMAMLNNGRAGWSAVAHMESNVTIASELAPPASGPNLAGRKHEVGFFPIEKTAAGATDPLFLGKLQGTAQPYFALHHSDFVIPTAVSSDFVQIASASTAKPAFIPTSQKPNSARCESQAFAYRGAKDRILYTVQFHPECERWAEFTDADWKGAEKVQGDGQKLFLNFFEIAESWWNKLAAPPTDPA